MTANRICLNGVDASTGRYLVEPIEVGEVATLARGEPIDRRRDNWFRTILRRRRKHLGLPPGVDPLDVARAGWGVVFHKDESPAIVEALEPLVSHRRDELGDGNVKELQYQTGEGQRDWLERHGVTRGSVQPSRVPYYLLLVGDPAKIPFQFQHELDVEYAVGRLDLSSSAAYRRYVESLVDSERSSAAPNTREAVFFATRHLADEATRLSADLLVKPLADGLKGAGVAARTFLGRTKGAEATRANLLELLAGRPGIDQPGFLFMATHGMGWPKDHPSQADQQGALLCQDWPGFGQQAMTHCVTAADVADAARVQGMIMFLFACYGAGCPDEDSFLHGTGKAPEQIASRPFGAALPKRLLAHPGGGALAVIGHVDRAWSCSYIGPLPEPQAHFQYMVDRLIAGEPVGHAMTDFRDRYSALSTDLTTILGNMQAARAQYPDEELAQLWVERNDAQNYVVLGDPAVRLRTGNPR